MPHDVDAKTARRVRLVGKVEFVRRGKHFALPLGGHGLDKLNHIAGGQRLFAQRMQLAVDLDGWRKLGG